MNIDRERKSMIDIGLTGMSESLLDLRVESKVVMDTIEAYYESLDDDNFPHKQNVYRFIEKYKSVFTERTLSLADEVETLRKDWQLKAGTFNKLRGVWEYE